jgi:hypothetical protein
MADVQQDPRGSGNVEFKKLVGYVEVHETTWVERLRTNTRERVGRGDGSDTGSSLSWESCNASPSAFDRRS